MRNSPRVAFKHNDICTQQMQSLANINSNFKEIYIYLNATLESWRNGQDIESFNAPQLNLINWYKSVTQSYPEDIVKNSYGPKRSSHDISVVREIAKSDFFFLRVISEIMMKDFTQADIAPLSPNNIRTFNTTPHDDTFHGIDAIIETIEENEGTNPITTYYTGIDFVITENSESLARKSGRKTDVNFWRDPDMLRENKITESNFKGERRRNIKESDFYNQTCYQDSMPRYILEFNRNTIAFAFEKYLREICAGKDPSTNILTIFHNAEEEAKNKIGPHSTMVQASIEGIKDEITSLLTSYNPSSSHKVA